MAVNGKGIQVQNGHVTEEQIKDVFPQNHKKIIGDLLKRGILTETSKKEEKKAKEGD